MCSIYSVLCNTLTILQWLGSSGTGGQDDCDAEAVSLDSCTSALELSNTRKLVLLISIPLYRACVLLFKTKVTELKHFVVDGCLCFVSD